MSFWDGRQWAPDPKFAPPPPKKANRARAAAITLILLLGVIVAAIPPGSRAGTQTLEAEPAAAAAAEQVWVTGGSFTPGATVEIRWRPADAAAATLTVSPRGTLKVRLTVPNLAPGVYTMSATAATPVVESATTVFTITAPASADGAKRSTTPPSGDRGGTDGTTPSPSPTAAPTPVPDSAAPTTAPVVTTPAPVVATPAPQPTVTDTPGFRFVITIYNNDGANVALGAMRPYLRSGDIFLVLSGNNGNQLNVPWVNQVASRLVAGVPGTTVYAATAGTANGAALAAGVGWPVTGIAYVYEPNMANEPEFSWDFATTQAHFRTFANAAHAQGLLAIGKPTGRPLLENGKVAYGWSYGTLGTIMDVQTPQFQTWCRQGLYPQALDKAIVQYGAAGVPARFYPEISLDLGSINGVPATTAIACSQRAVQRGLPGALVWWAPPYANEAIKYLAAFRSPR